MTKLDKTDIENIKLIFKETNIKKRFLNHGNFYKKKISIQS